MASNGVFGRFCRALMAAAAGIPKDTRETRVLKVGPISPELKKFMGVPSTCRTDAVRKVWAHIVQHKLQELDDPNFIHCDDELKPLFDGQESVKLLDIPKLLSLHFKEK
ncbi:protein TRI1-like [Cornus florida]|uniref:protein TRI1-like n=1 Tax=Cornus florida TaxID=4283 RepID=UPI0028997EAF|nr:protein TRI1-like [Cornus florida]